MVQKDNYLVKKDFQDSRFAVQNDEAYRREKQGIPVIYKYTKNLIKRSNNLPKKSQKKTYK